MKNILNTLVSNPKVVFWLCLLSNMVPSILLVFTEPLNWTGIIILLLFPLALYLVFYSLFRKTAKLQLFLIPLMVIHAFQIVVHNLFGEGVVAADMYLNVITTNVNEAGEVLAGIIWAVVAVCLIYIPIIIIAIVGTKRKIKLDKSYRQHTFKYGILIGVISIILSPFSKDINTNEFIFYREVYPVNILYNGGYAIKKWTISSNFEERSENFKYHAQKKKHTDKREIYVMVIGETCRAENWSLYGYERKTNPRLEGVKNLTFFSDAITQSNVTHKSVPIILSTGSAENFDIIYERKSIITAFSEAGFKTIFLSNQSPNHTLTDYFAQEADYSSYYRSLTSPVNHHDCDMLPEFKELINSTDEDLFIVIHSYGSHFNYMERYPEEFAIFQPDEITKISKSGREGLINAYDNSTLYTDHFLDQVIGILDETEECTAMIFSSDHGEDILDDKRNRFLHASPVPTFYQMKIPMFIWFSDNYIGTFTEKQNNAIENKDMPVATNALFHTMMDIAEVESMYVNYELSLVSGQFKKVKRKFLDEYDEPLFINELNLKKEDEDMMKLRGMYY